MNHQKTKGFTLMELIVIMGFFVAITLVAVLYLNKFRRERSLTWTTNAVVAVLRDAQQRSIVQEESNYWGVKLESFSSPNRYFIFKSPDAAMSAMATSTINFLRGSINFADPPSGSSTTVFFDKFNGNLIKQGCPAATVSTTIKLVYAGDGVSTTIRIYCNGRIEL